MTKISEEKFEVVATAINSFRYSDDLRPIQVYNMASYGEKELQLEINWAAIGTVSTEKTLAFAENLRKTAEMVDTINAMGFELVRTDESVFTSKEEYMQAKLEVIEMAKNYETGKIIAWLIK